MARYWWQCISCGDRPAWLTVCRSRSIAAFIWDELAPSGWDQRLLLRRCKCKRHSLRITYHFRRGDPERISIKRIVGLGPEGEYLPMLWISASCFAGASASAILCASHTTFGGAILRGSVSSE